MAQEITKEFANKLMGIVLQQYKTGVDFKRGRMEEIRKNEEFYLGRKLKVPKGRYGVTLPTMEAFVDDLMSKIDDAPSVKYGYRDIADKRFSEKISSAWEVDSHPNKANWPLKDRWAKLLACFSGRAIYKVYSESEPRYKHYLETVDYEDFITEPMGGGDLNSHVFKGQDNIFRTNDEIKNNAKSGLYNADQVNQLFGRMNDDGYKKAEDIYKYRAKRMESLGLNLTANTYVGVPIVKLVEWVTRYEGEEYYVLFNYETSTWIRVALLKDVTESGLCPWVSWATHEHPLIFWSKAPCDSMRPIVETLDVLVNQALENREKINNGQRAFDPAIFPDPSELEWRPGGLVQAKASIKGKSISEGIYEFKAPEIQGTIDLIQWMRNYSRVETGINPMEAGAQNESDQKVGIYFGRLQQMADRIGLRNKSYREAYMGMGLRYAYGLKENLREPMMVKMIGESGVEWEELTRGEAQKAPDLDLDLSSGSAEAMANEAKARRRAESLAAILKNQRLSEQINQGWLAAETLKQGYDDSEIRIALSKEGGSLDSISRAAEAIQMILLGKEPKVYRGADTAFLQKINDFMIDEELEPEDYNSLSNYFQKHVRIVFENTMRRANAVKLDMFMNRGGAPNMQSVSESVQIPERNAGSPLAPGISGNQATNILQGKTLPSEVNQ